MQKKRFDLKGFGRRLYEARNLGAVERTHAQIASACGISRVAVTKWEGNANPAIKPDNLFKVADFLGVRARWLACEQGPRDIELSDAATRVAEDWATLPEPYQAAIRKHLDDLLAAVQLLPQLRRPVSNVPVERAGFIAVNHQPRPPRTTRLEKAVQKPRKERP